jgi:hypothetical protein
MHQLILINKKENTPSKNMPGTIYRDNHWQNTKSYLLHQILLKFKHPIFLVGQR